MRERLVAAWLLLLAKLGVGVERDRVGEVRAWRAEEHGVQSSVGYRSPPTSIVVFRDSDVIDLWEVVLTRGRDNFRGSRIALLPCTVLVWKGGGGVARKKEMEGEILTYVQRELERERVRERVRVIK